MFGTQSKYYWHLIYIGVFCLSAGFALFAWRTTSHAIQSDFEKVAEASLQHNIEVLKSRFESGLVRTLQTAHGIAAIVSTEPRMPQEKFSNLTSHLTAKAPAISVVFSAPDLVVSHVYPEGGNKGSLGLDLRDFPDQMRAIELARTADDSVLLGPVDLLQGGRGFLSATSIHVTTPLTNAPSIWGSLVAEVDVRQLLQNAGFFDPNAEFEAAIRSRTAEGNFSPVFFGSGGILKETPLYIDVDVPGGDWQIAAIPSGGWVAEPDYMGLVLFRFRVGSVVFIFIVMLATRLAQLRLRAERRLHNAINSLDDGFAFFDEKDRLVLCNQKYREYYDLPADLLSRGTRFESIAREGLVRGQFPDAAGHEEEWLAGYLATHRAAETSFEQNLADGRCLKIAESRTPDGGTVGYQVDVTELKTAIDQAKQASLAKSEFLSVMSHELRTPLTVILGFTSFFSSPEVLSSFQRLKTLTENPPLDPSALADQLDELRKEVSGYGEKVGKSGRHLLTLINDMLDLSKIEADKMEIRIQPTPVGPILSSIMDEFKPSAESKGLALTCETSREVVCADGLRLKQMLINLVGNALKFTQTGSINIQTKRQGDFVEFLVTDTGCGIPDNEQAFVFERFRQVDASATRKAGGTGLGLAITKRFAELHGGEVAVKSTPGEGSTFSFTIPAADPNT